jgi:hypothetical protein
MIKIIKIIHKSAHQPDLRLSHGPPISRTDLPPPFEPSKFIHVPQLTAGMLLEWPTTTVRSDKWQLRFKLYKENLFTAFLLDGKN